MPLKFPVFTPVLILPTPEGWPGWLGLGGWLKPRGWERGSNPSHHCTNRAWCMLTTLIVTNALPLHLTATAVMTSQTRLSIYTSQRGDWKRGSRNRGTRIQGSKTREKRVWKAKINVNKTFLSQTQLSTTGIIVSCSMWHCPASTDRWTVHSWFKLAQDRSSFYGVNRLVYINLCFNSAQAHSWYCWVNLLWFKPHVTTSKNSTQSPTALHCSRRLQ